ncbi:MAG: hypothetical protein ACI89E_000832 [Planctomycetota bacterium]|jgi:hypothetical protein
MRNGQSFHNNFDVTSGRKDPKFIPLFEQERHDREGWALEAPNQENYARRSP